MTDMTVERKVTYKIEASSDWKLLLQNLKCCWKALGTRKSETITFFAIVTLHQLKQLV